VLWAADRKPWPVTGALAEADDDRASPRGMSDGPGQIIRQMVPELLRVRAFALAARDMKADLEMAAYEAFDEGISFEKTKREDEDDMANDQRLFGEPSPIGHGVQAPRPSQPVLGRTD